MASEDLDLDVEAAEAPKSGSKKLVIIIAAALLLIGGGLAAVFMSGMLDDKPPAEAPPAEGEAAPAGEEAAPPPGAPQLYQALNPAFVVNFAGETDVRFLQVEMQISTRDPNVIMQVKEHMPAIRNAIVLLLSSQEPGSLDSREGKEALRLAVLEDIKKVMEEVTGKAGVDNVYFTSFVMQ